MVPVIDRSSLEDDTKLNALYQGAMERGLLGMAESDRLAYFGAAEHALRVTKAAAARPAGKGGDEAGNLFVYLLRTKEWGKITDEDDHRAAARLRRIDGVAESPTIPIFTIMEKTPPADSTADAARSAENLSPLGESWRRFLKGGGLAEVLSRREACGKEVGWLKRIQARFLRRDVQPHSVSTVVPAPTQEVLDDHHRDFEAEMAREGDPWQ